jgi:hypothetical protein
VTNAAQRGIVMLSHCFGRKLKLPSTAAIKHQLLMLMLEDEIRAVPAGSFKADTSSTLEKLRRLRTPLSPVQPI